MSDTVTIHGSVSDTSHTPIFMIKVRAFQRDHELEMEDREVERTYTGEDGVYSFEVPRAPTTLIFDTHGSLTNARDWHPSVVANIDPPDDDKYVRCDRILMKVGLGTPTVSCIDALAGYTFGNLLCAREPDSGYAEAAASRLSMMKVPPQLSQIRQLLLDSFHEQTK